MLLPNKSALEALIWRQSQDAISSSHEAYTSYLWKQCLQESSNFDYIFTTRLSNVVQHDLVKKGFIQNGFLLYFLSLQYFPTS